MKNNVGRDNSEAQSDGVVITEIDSNVSIIDGIVIDVAQPPASDVDRARNECRRVKCRQKIERQTSHATQT